MKPQKIFYKNISATIIIHSLATCRSTNLSRRTPSWKKPSLDIKDPSTIDIFSAKDKVYSQKVKEALHDNLPASTVKNYVPTPEESKELLNVSMVQDQEYISRSFGPKYRIELRKHEVHRPVKKDAVLEKALASYTKDPTKLDVFTAEGKAYTEIVNFGLSHHMTPESASLKPLKSQAPTPEQAPLPCMAPKAHALLNVSSPEDQEFVNRAFGPKSREYHH